MGASYRPRSNHQCCNATVCKLQPMGQTQAPSVSVGAPAGQLRPPCDTPPAAAPRRRRRATSSFQHTHPRASIIHTPLRKGDDARMLPRLQATCGGTSCASLPRDTQLSHTRYGPLREHPGTHEAAEQPSVLYRLERRFCSSIRSCHPGKVPTPVLSS